MLEDMEKREILVTMVSDEADVNEKRGRNSTVECNLPKVEVAGSSPVARSTKETDRCPSCGTPGQYDEHWDSYFCLGCDQWLSEPCGATTYKECPYECWRRAEKPSLVPAYYIIGADEVGRGCLAGPLCVGAVMVLGDMPPVSGVGDSKALTPKKREEVRLALKDLHQAVVFVGAGDIDRDGIGPCLKRAFRQAITQLLDQRTEPNRHTEVLVDGNPMNLDLEAGYETDLTMKFLIKGDATDWRIGAASIIAKVTRDEIMVREARNHPGYGFEANKGYGSAEHQEAIRVRGLTPLHRKTFCRRFLEVADENVLDLF